MSYKKIINLKYTIYFILFMIAGQAIAQCPTVASTNQEFCDSDSPTVSNLIATDSGSGISWYDSQTGGNLIPSTESLFNTSYWADNVTGDCGSRIEVVVTVFAPPVNVAFGISRCTSQENTIAQLTVPGTNIEWFDAINGGNFLPSNTPLVDGVTYFVQQTENGCISLRSSTTVTIVDPPAPTGTDQTFCIASGATIPTIADLVINGQNIIWYSTQTSNTELPTSIELVDGQSYFATQTIPARGCESSQRLEVVVTINTQPSSGTNGDLDICDSSTASINLFNELEDSPDLGGSWAGPETTTNGDQGTLDTSLLGPGSFVFTYTTASLTACVPVSSTVTVNVQEEPDAGENNNLEICTNESAVNLFDLLVGASNAGTPDAGGTWSGPSSTTNGDQGNFDPATNISGTYTYTVTGTAPCTVDTTATITVIVEQAPVAGADASLDLCTSDSATDLFDSLIGADAGGTWSPTLTSGTGVFDQTVDQAGDYTYTLAPTATCPGDESIVSVTIIPAPVAGENASTEICLNDTAIDLFTILGGTPDAGGTWTGPSATTNGDQGTFDPAANLAGDYTYTVTATSPCTIDDIAVITVTIQQPPNAGTNANVDYCTSDPIVNLFSLLGTADAGGTWSGPSTLTNGDQGTFDPASNTPGDYIYTLAATAICPENESVVTITIVPQPVAGENASIEICLNDTAIDLFTILGGTPDTGGTWTGPSATTNGDQGTFDPAADLAGDYTYTVAATTPCTVDDTAVVTVIIQQPLNPGTNANAEYCTSDPIVNLFSLLGTADVGGTWSGPSTLTNGDQGTFDPASNTPGDYTYTLAATTVCDSVESVVSVTVSTQPFAGDDNTIELCTNDATVDLFTQLGGTPDTNGTWSPILTSGTGVYDPAVDLGVVYTYTVPAIGTCLADDATVTVNLNTLPNAGTDAEITVCGDTAAFDLFTLLGGSPNASGTWSGPSAITNGDQGTFDPAFNLSGDYVYTSAGSGACEDISATVTVTIINPTPTLPIDGEIFCISDNPLISDLIARVTPEMAGTIQVYTTNTSTTPLAEITPIVNGDTYFISETDVTTSCEGTNRLVVTIQINNPETPQLSNSTAEFCLIDAPTIADLNAFIAQGNNVVWVDAITNGNQFNETDPLVSGDYFAIEEDVNTCRSAASTVISIMINDNPAPTLNPNGNELCGIEEPTIAELEANLTAESGLDIVWYDLAQGGSRLNTTDSLIDNTTYFAATLNTTTGCESNTRLEITIDLTACDLDQFPLLLPDGFSPNGDNINDVYEFEDVEFLYEDYTIEIYNRYGNLLYEGDISTPPWDGRSNQSSAIGNKIVPNGVYFYIFNFNRNNVPPRQGRLYLNR